MFALDIRGRARQADQAKVVIHSEQRLGAAQKEIPVGKKVVVKVLNHFSLGHQVKVDQHIAAEDNVEAFHKVHASVVRQIQAAERDTLADARLELALLPGWHEVFLAIVVG
jgi:hypothetical protein